MEEKWKFNFKKKGYDPTRQHKSLKHKSIWKADLHSKENYIPYSLSIIADARSQITAILERELNERGK
jgi:hypothetical protein